MKQLALPIVTRPEPGFDAFVPGANALALRELLALAPAPALPSPPVYVWGPSGSGKTHLLRALATRFRRDHAAVAWFGAADPAPWALAPAVQLIVLDGCEAFDAAQQHAAFALFVEAAGQPCCIVAAGRLPPVDLPLREDLRTRLGWGHVLALQTLGEADTRTALRRRAHDCGLTLADEVINYLLTHFARDLTHLMAQLDRLDRFALTEQRAITLPMLRAMLAEATATSP